MGKKSQRNPFGRRGASLRAPIASLGVAALLSGSSPAVAGCPCEEGPAVGAVEYGGHGPCAPHPPAYAPEAAGDPYADSPYVGPNGLVPQEGPQGLAGEPGADLGAGAGMPAGLGAVAAASSPATNMIGDFFGSGYFLNDGEGNFASVPSAGGDRRFKATDNISPVPQDRVFFNYHHFHNAVLDVNTDQQNVNRFTLGIEKTLLDEMMSVEVRAPIVDGLDGLQQTYGQSPTTSSQFGNLSVTTKVRLVQRGPWLMTGGVSVILPTGSDAEIRSTGSNVLLENEAVHLQPFLGLLLDRPETRWFTQAYVGVDVDVNGNPLIERVPQSIGFLDNPVGVVQDQTLLFADWQLGYWLYQDYGHVGYLNGIAPVLEVHVTQALNEPDQAAFIDAPFGTPTLVNLTGGLVFDLRREATVVVYGAAPLNREEATISGVEVSPVFDAEVGVQCVYRY